MKQEIKKFRLLPKSLFDIQAESIISYNTVVNPPSTLMCQPFT